MSTTYPITAAEHAEMTAEIARLEVELPTAQAARDDWETRMDGTQKFDWEKLYRLNRAVRDIEKRLLDIDQFLMSCTVEPVPAVAA